MKVHVNRNQPLDNDNVSECLQRMSKFLLSAREMLPVFDVHGAERFIPHPGNVAADPHSSVLVDLAQPCSATSPAPRGLGGNPTSDRPGKQNKTHHSFQTHRSRWIASSGWRALMCYSHATPWSQSNAYFKLFQIHFRHTMTSCLHSSDLRNRVAKRKNMQTW